jgi:hypothetical protein
VFGKDFCPERRSGRSHESNRACCEPPANQAA